MARFEKGVRFGATSLLMAVGGVLPAPALGFSSGQSTPAPSPGSPGAVAANDGGAAEIIVTARRREERLLDVPMSISAFTGEDIAARGVGALTDLQASVPGLRIVDIGPGSQRIQLRGVSQYLGLPTVGNYIDEFSVNPESASGAAEIRLLDMERVEVLRGPQPALYGEGSMGGTIRYVTAAPDLDEFGGNLLGEISSIRGGEMGYRLEGVLNLPIATDVAGLRLAGTREEVGGWTDGALGRDLNDVEVTTLRGRLLIEPSPAFSISLLGLFHESEQQVKSYSGEDRVTEQVVPSPAEQRYYLGNLVLSYDAGPVTLLSSTGYLNQDGRSVDDSGPFYNDLFGAPLLRTAVTDTNSNFERWAQELRVTSNGAGPLRYLVGASYAEARSAGVIDGDGESLVPGLPASSLGVVFRQVSATRSQVWALFGSLSYDLSDRITLDVGGRYFNDRRSVDSTFTLIGLPVPPSVAADSASFDTFNPRVNLSFRTSSAGIIYLNAAKGFRSGGFNQVLDPATPPTFGPETLWTYEIGARQSILGNQLLVEAALYYSDYKDIQAVIIQPGGTVSATRNAGNADGFGFDLSLLARPARDLSISATLGYVDISYNTDSIDRNAGDPPDLVPDWTWSAAVDYTPRLSANVGLIAHVDIGFVDKAQITLRNLPQIAFSDSRVLVNARLGVSLSNIDLYAFASNLFDENRIVNPAFGAFFEPIRTRPRTVGLGARARF